ncbi:MAG: helix-turn-helix domain-containing protein [bacterium]
MNIVELAHYLGVSRRKLYEMCQRHEIPFARIGRQLRFSKKKIDEWMDSMTKKA